MRAHKLQVHVMLASGNCRELTRNLSPDFACNRFAARQSHAKQYREGYINHFAAQAVSAYVQIQLTESLNQQPLRDYMVVFHGLFVHCVSMQYQYWLSGMQL